jgi:hypothetical protein
VVSGVERVGDRLKRVLLLGLVALGGLSAGACGISNDLYNGYSGPLAVLKNTDVVVETNLKTMETTLQMGEPEAAAMGGTTSGPSTGANVVSVSDPPSGPIVLAGYNDDSRDCLGMLVIKTPGVAVLGQAQPGTYYFWETGTTSPSCDAATFAATATIPGGWPTGDPSSSGWPAS